MKATIKFLFLATATAMTQASPVSAQLPLHQPVEPIQQPGIQFPQQQSEQQPLRQQQQPLRQQQQPLRQQQQTLGNQQQPGQLNLPRVALPQQVPQVLSNANLRDIDNMVVYLTSLTKQLHDEYHDHFEGIRHTQKLDDDVTAF